jgi:hypothetical protein
VDQVSLQEVAPAVADEGQEQGVRREQQRRVRGHLDTKLILPGLFANLYIINGFNLYNDACRLDS